MTPIKHSENPERIMLRFPTGDRASGAPRVSVVLSTYNAPASLAKAMHGYAAQSFSDFEVIVADDGSTQETALLLARLRNELKLDIRHEWQTDQGFRKTRIMNRAIKAAQGEYLVFSDGDCVPRRDFLEIHVASAERGRFLSGGCLRLPLLLSQRIEPSDIASGQAFNPRWLREHGAPRGLRFRALARGSRINVFANRLTTTRPTWNGHNASGWRDDLIRVNGFDERMGYGGEDRELGERLMNAGVRPRQVRFSAICLHLEHSRGYVTQAQWDHNNQIRRQTRRDGAVWTDYGIRQASSESRPTAAPLMLHRAA